MFNIFSGYIYEYGNISGEYNTLLFLNTRQYSGGARLKIMSSKALTRKLKLYKALLILAFLVFIDCNKLNHFVV